MTRLIIANVIGAVAACGLLTLMDVLGVFVALSYLPAILLVLLVVAELAWLGKNSGGWLRRLPLGTFLLLAVVLLALPYLPTCPRKAFAVAADSIAPGMAIAEVCRIMSPFDIAPFGQHPRSMTFRFRSDPQTVDALIVTFDSDGRVLTARFSPD
jgi:hypothetical protein